MADLETNKRKKIEYIKKWYMENCGTISCLECPLADENCICLIDVIKERLS